MTRTGGERLVACLKADGGVIDAEDGFFLDSAVVEASEYVGLRDDIGVAGTDSVGLPLPISYVPLTGTKDGGGIDDVADRDAGGTALFGLGTDAVCSGVLEELDLMSSAASLTLVGTRLRRIAPEADVVVEDVVSLLALPGLIVDSLSVAVAHGEGRGLSGEMSEADEDKVAMLPGPRPPIMGILRASNEEGFRNSDGRRWREGLAIGKVPPVLSLSRLGLVGGSFDFAFSLLAKLPLFDELDAEAVSQFDPRPSPSTLPLSLVSGSGERLTPSSSIASKSGLPNASGEDPA